MVVHTYNPSTQEAEAGGSEFKAICFKKPRRKKRGDLG
jgi:hypothetical protein